MVAALLALFVIVNSPGIVQPPSQLSCSLQNIQIVALIGLRKRCLHLGKVTKRKRWHASWSQIHDKGGVGGKHRATEVWGASTQTFIMSRFIFWSTYSCINMSTWQMDVEVHISIHGYVYRFESPVTTILKMGVRSGGVVPNIKRSCHGLWFRRSDSCQDRQTMKIWSVCMCLVNAMPTTKLLNQLGNLPRQWHRWRQLCCADMTNTTFQLCMYHATLRSHNWPKQCGCCSDKTTILWMIFDNDIEKPVNDND